MTLNLWHGPTNVAEQALDRLQELAPEEATRILREDVGQPEPRFANMALHELPPQDIPAVDALVSNKLKANQIPPLPLAARYASRQVLKPMQQVHAGMKHLACEPEASFVTYFVRVDATIGKRVLSDAMASRERRGCFRSLLGHVAGVVWNPVVERAALAGLDDPDSGVASDAARVLSIHGGPAAEEALWSHLEKWSERWRGKANQLEAHPITREDPNRTEREYGNSLFSAVEQARGWIIDEARAHRLATLYIDDWNRDRLSHYKFGPVRIDAANGGAIYGKVFNFGQYRLGRFEDVKSKMAQYPAGTVFQWCSAPYGDGFVKEELQEMFDQLKRFGAERGLRVEPCSEKEQ
jgi:hypothetical protein